MSFHHIVEASSFIRNKILDHLGKIDEKNNIEAKNKLPKVGIILGSGLGDYVEQITAILKLPFESIPYFKKTSVEGHSGALIFGFVEKAPIIVLQGRIHPYEGYPMEEIVFPVRVMAHLGVKNLIISNASGGINENYQPGDLVVITDHINLTGRNPLVGKNMDELGPRFPDMSNAYHSQLISLLLNNAKKHQLNLKKGVYCSVLGPSYETPAEVRMLKILGADLVGMSTVSEVIAAHHAGIKVAGVACVTNYAAGIREEKLSHDDVKKVAEKAMVGFKTILSETVISLYQLDE